MFPSWDQVFGRWSMNEGRREEHPGKVLPATRRCEVASWRMVEGSRTREVADAA